LDVRSLSEELLTVCDSIQASFIQTKASKASEKLSTIFLPIVSSSLCLVGPVGFPLWLGERTELISYVGLNQQTKADERCHGLT
jgi:hypothetical protein